MAGPFLQEPMAVDLYVRVCLNRVRLVELAIFWTLFGPYVPARWRPRGNGPQRLVNRLGRGRPLRTTYN
jgi:hypothetical protein